jgi:hypothetical protein
MRKNTKSTLPLKIALWYIKFRKIKLDFLFTCYFYIGLWMPLSILTMLITFYRSMGHKFGDLSIPIAPLEESKDKKVNYYIHYSNWRNFERILWIWKFGLLDFDYDDLLYVYQKYPTVSEEIVFYGDFYEDSEYLRKRLGERFQNKEITLTFTPNDNKYKFETDKHPGVKQDLEFGRIQMPMSILLD